MNANVWYPLVVTSLAFLFAIMSAMIGVLWKVAIDWGRLTTEVKHLAESIGQIAVDTNERLQWLERHNGRDLTR
jgi:hypothetical protein